MSKVVRFTFRALSPATLFPESYTIFGAICWGIKILFGEKDLKEILERFKESPLFILSSPLFITERGLLFPKPTLDGGWLESKNPEDYSLRKKLKGVNFVNEEIFKAILDGEIRTEYELSKRISESEKIENPYEKLNTVHATINRITWTTTEGNLYNETAFYVSYPFSVLMVFFDEDLIDKVHASLKFTQIGGNRSTGMGVYKVELEEYNGWLNDYINGKKGNRFISLSPHFYDGTYRLEESFFNTFPYMGVVDNYYEAVIPHIWKKRVLYIDKGSNIKVERNKDFYGAFKNLSRIEDKPIYQYGYAFPIFVRWE
ncbi:MAG TPA: type III-A CRISPR-associated RAMP protein Csm4 [Aquifex aeolicus]|nr:type III-A CRISPR-associated RAMP protein Csm4 [Aquifex aeolicus]